MKNQKIVVIDYGLGNIYSVVRALEVCGAANICVSSKPEDITNADKLILPGVGAFEDGIRGINNLGLIDPIKKHAEQNKPLLGICLGMQLMATSSEEFGTHKGLNLIPGRVLPIPVDTLNNEKRKIPFIGWSSLSKPTNNAWNETLLSKMGDDMAVYLVHSYHFVPEKRINLLATYNFKGDPVTAAVNSQNTYGFQFHPEKSGEVGLKLLNAFLSMP